jgi:hypothetical protein
MPVVIELRPDGAVVSIGDGTSFNYADPRTQNAIADTSRADPRIDPATGHSADNPFASGVSPTATERRCSSSVRNPFSVTFAPDGQLFMPTPAELVGDHTAGGRGAVFEGGDGGVNLQTRPMLLPAATPLQRRRPAPSTSPRRFAPFPNAPIQG